MVVSNPYLLVFGFDWGIILYMVVLCLTYIGHSILQTSLIRDVAFQVAGTNTQLVDLSNRNTLYSIVVGEILVD